MNSNLTPIDVTQLSTMSDFLALMEEVNTTRQPRLLTRNNETLVMLTPVVGKAGKSKKSKKKKQADSSSLLALAGSLKGLIDAEKLKKDIYESRRLLTRSLVEL